MDDEREVLRAAIAQTRQMDTMRRAQLDEMLADTRVSLLGGEPDPISLRMHECLVVERALLDALMRNTEAMSRVLEDAMREG